MTVWRAKHKRRHVSPPLLALLSLLLFIGALVQAAYFMRTELAAYLPQSKPYLKAACDYLGCTIELPKNASLLTIDDSDLREDPLHEGVYTLTCTLLNRAPYTQAYPLLEVVLTNLDDRPVLRRILAPGEYLQPETPVESGLPADSEVHIKLFFTADTVKATGYRIFVTYRKGGANH